MMMERFATQGAARLGDNGTAGWLPAFLAQTGILYLFHLVPVIIIILMWISENNGNPQ